MERTKNNKTVTLFFLYFFCYISYLILYLSRQAISVATPVLKEENIMSAFQIGLLGTVFSVVYSAGRLVNGRIGDKVEPKIMVSSGLIIICVTNFLFARFLPFGFEIVFWGLNAYGQSMLWGPMLRTMTAVMPEKKITGLMSIFATSIPMGTVFGIIICTKMITISGPSWAFYVPSAMAVICAVLTFFMIGKCTRNAKNGKEDKTVQPEKAKLKDVIRNKILLSSLVPSMLHGVIKENVNLWLSLYFVTKFSIDLKESILVLFAIPLVGMVGRLIYPFTFKLLKENEYKVMITGFIICVVCSGILTAIPGAENATLINIISAACCLALISAAVSLINHSLLTMIPIRFSKINASSTVAGMIDFIAYVGSAIGSLIYGWMFDRNYSFSWMFVSWIIISLISILICLISDRKKYLDKYFKT